MTASRSRRHVAVLIAVGVLFLTIPGAVLSPGRAGLAVQVPPDELPTAPPPVDETLAAGQAKIRRLFDAFKPEMTEPEVYALLGPEDDYRTDPNASEGRARPMWGGEPDYDDLDGELGFYLNDLAYDRLWHWDYGSIMVGIWPANWWQEPNNPPQLQVKRMTLRKGPRPFHERLTDPLRYVLERR